MKIILIAIVAVAVTQFIKTIWFYYNNKSTLNSYSFFWSTFWMGGFPSSHTAALASAMYAIWKYDGASQLFGFAAVVSLILIYGLLEDKKRQTLFNEYFVQSDDFSLRKIVTEGRLLSFNGHSFWEIFVGGFVGVVISIVITTFVV